MDDRTEDTEDLDLLLEDADERDLENLVASLMLEMVRRIGQLFFIRRGLEMVGGLVGLVGWLEEEVSAGVSGGSIAEQLPL